jgi:polysaccharide export outer membrane protein
MKSVIRLMLFGSLAVSALVAQQSATPTPDKTETPADPLRPTYVLGPGDQISIRAFEVEEISTTFRIDSEGEINLPTLGKVHAGGLTVEQFEHELADRLKTLVRNPQVSVSVVQFRSEPIFLQGAFKAPGIYTLQGRRTLREMLASSGGLQSNASRRITVTRHLEMGTIPLPNAVVDEARKLSTVEINISKLRDNLNPVEDIVLQPLDTITVDKAELVYANGEVTRVGGIELGERDSISTTQFLSMIGGLGKDAAPDKARVLRPVLNTSKRAEIPVNLKKILAGKESDFPLLPNDVLYVPKASRGGRALGQMGIVVIPVATGLIYVLASRL